MKFQISALLFLISLFSQLNGLKILGILPLASKSHWAIGHNIIKALVDAGHEATVFTPYPMKNPIENYHEIDISEFARKIEKGKKITKLNLTSKNYFKLFLDPAMNAFVLRKLPKIISAPFLHNWGNEIASDVLEHSKVQEFLKKKEKFDICFLEVFHVNSLSVSC